MANTKESEKYDIIIIGGGPAGLAAALYAGRSKVRTLLIETKVLGGQLYNTELIEDYPGVASILGPDLAGIMSKQAEQFGTEIITEDVTNINIDERSPEKIVQTDRGSYIAPAVIITAGGLPRKLDIPGEEEFAGRGVSYCAVCDGAFFQGNDLAVVGGGDAAVEEAIFLTRYAKKVTLIHRRDSFRAQPILVNEAMKHPKITVLFDSVVESIEGDQKVAEVKLRNVKTHKQTSLTVQGVFVFVGFIPNTGLLEHHVAHDDGGYFMTDSQTMMTSIPGVFAAGDVRSQLTRQITTAVGDATTATLAAVKWSEAVAKKLPMPYEPYHAKEMVGNRG